MEVLVKCSQTGKKIKAKGGNLSRKDSKPLTAKDLSKGSNLLVEVNGTSYPMTFVEFIGMYLPVYLILYIAQH